MLPGMDDEFVSVPFTQRAGHHGHLDELRVAPTTVRILTGITLRRRRRAGMR
jgi:hypothetical protein